ncbi:probable CoA ligase CCL10 isoform X1 [Fagus crenata]
MLAKTNPQTQNPNPQPQTPHRQPQPHPTLMNPNEDLTFHQLKLQVSKLAHSLLLINVHKNDVVLIATPNSVHFLVCFLATVALGAIASSNPPILF